MPLTKTARILLTTDPNYWVELKQHAREQWLNLERRAGNQHASAGSASRIASACTGRDGRQCHRADGRLDSVHFHMGRRLPLCCRPRRCRVFACAAYADSLARWQFSAI